MPKKDPSIKMPLATPEAVVPEIAPVELAPSGVKLQIPWRIVIPVVAFLIGGGTLTAVTQAFTGATEPAGLATFKKDQDSQHAQINKTLEDQDKRAKKQDERIDDISKTVKSVQSTQLRDVARTEARRLTEKIPNRLERENTYDRIYELNLRRLERGSDPCGSISCD